MKFIINKKIIVEHIRKDKIIYKELNKIILQTFQGQNTENINNDDLSP